MSRNVGDFIFPANFEVTKVEPLDGRQLVGTKADLTGVTTWNQSGGVWLYDGAIVSVGQDPVADNNGIYFLASASTYTDINSWVKAGSGEGGGTITGGANGLSTSGTNVVLGGALTGDTSVGLCGNYFQFENPSGSYFAQTGFTGAACDGSMMSDGTLIVGGGFSSYSGCSVCGIMAINPDHSVNSSIDFGTGFSYNFFGTVHGVTVDADDKIMAVGYFTEYCDGTSSCKIIRLCSDGSRDASFVVGTGFNSGNSADHVTASSDGKYIVTGNFFQYQGSSSSRLVRIDSGGTRDASFQVATSFGFDRATWKSQILNDDTVVVIGGFTQYSGVSTQGIVGVTCANGDIASSFATGAGLAGGGSTSIYGRDMDYDSNLDRLYVGGDFTTYSGLTAGHFVALCSDGTIDTAFDCGTGFNTGVTSVHVQGDGKVIVGGDFTSYSGCSLGVNQMVRLCTDGSLDLVYDATTCSTNILTDCQSKTVVIQIGGYSGYSMQGIAWLNADGTLSSGIAGEGGNILFSGNTLSTPNLTLTSIPAKSSETDILYVGSDGVVACGAASGVGGLAMSGSTVDGLTTYVDGSTICAQSTLTKTSVGGLQIESTGSIYSGVPSLTVTDTTTRGTMLLESQADNPVDFFFKSNGLLTWDISVRDLTHPMYFYPSTNGTSWGSPVLELHTGGTVCATTCFKAPAITLTTGAGSGCVLQSDGSGNATWATPTGGGGVAVSGTTDNAVTTYINATGDICAQPNITATATQLKVGNDTSCYSSGAVIHAETHNDCYGLYVLGNTGSTGTNYGAVISNPGGTPGGGTYGLYANAYYVAGSGSGRSHGLIGRAGGKTAGFNYGTIGQLCGTYGGAGIYGSYGSFASGMVAGCWAGYFCGPTYSSGALCVTSSITATGTLNTTTASLQAVRIACGTYYSAYDCAGSINRMMGMSSTVDKMTFGSIENTAACIAMYMGGGEKGCWMTTGSLQQKASTPEVMTFTETSTNLNPYIAFYCTTGPTRIGYLRGCGTNSTLNLVKDGGQSLVIGATYVCGTSCLTTPVVCATTCVRTATVIGTTCILISRGVGAPVIEGCQTFQTTSGLAGVGGYTASAGCGILGHYNGTARAGVFGFCSSTTTYSTTTHAGYFVGCVCINDTQASGYGLKVDTCGCAVDFVATSDCRMKKNITPISSALSTIDCLCGVCYDLCKNNSHDMGLIAQDVLKIEPRLVTTGDPSPEEKEDYGIEDQILGLKYDKFAGLFVEAIKELKAQNECLQNQINELRNK